MFTATCSTTPKILDVPADKLVAMYKKDTAEPREQAAETQKQVTDTRTQPETKPKQSKNWTYAIMYLVLFILVLASLALWRSRYAQEQVENTGNLDYPVTIVEHPDTPSYPALSAEMEEPEQTPASAETPEPETTLEYETAQDPEPELEPAAESLVTQAQSPETLTTGPETTPVYQETTITSGTGPDTVTLVLIVDCWIEIFDAENKKVFYDLARAGQTLVLSGIAPFSVLLGNADAATVEFNNTPFDITPHVTGIGIACFVLGANQ